MEPREGEAAQGDVSPDDARGYAEPPGTEPEDVALFLPRVVLALPRMAFRVVFFPITEALRIVDEYAVVEQVQDVLYNDARTAGVLPLLSASTFFGPTVGVKAFHDDLGGHGESSSAKVKFGGRYDQSYQVGFSANRFQGTWLWLETLTRYEEEPALLFQGIGHATATPEGPGLDPREAAVAARFRQQRMLHWVRAGYSVNMAGTPTRFGVTAIYNRRRFGAPTGGRFAELATTYEDLGRAVARAAR